MTALAANDTSLKRKPRGRLSVIVTNATTVYVGAGVGLTTAGRASPWADTAGMEWLGLSLGGTARNLPANAGGKVVGDTSYSPPHEVDVDTGGHVLLGVPVAGASAQADVGSRVYSSTDNLLTDLSLTPTTNVKAIGRIVRFNSATSFDVLLFTPAEYANQALQGDITALTDSTGLSGSHDDTVADPTTIGAALTDSTGGTPGDTLAAIAAAGTYADDDDAIRNAIASLAAKVNTLRTDNLVVAQNLSDITQKVNEILTALNLGN